VWNDLSIIFFIFLKVYIISEMQIVITSLAFNKHLIQYLHKCSRLVVFWEGGGKGFISCVEREGLES
jgi:hypothetical protein